MASLDNYSQFLQHVLGRTLLRPVLLRNLSKDQVLKVKSLDKALAKEGPMLVALLRLSSCNAIRINNHPSVTNISRICCPCRRFNDRTSSSNVRLLFRVS